MSGRGCARFALPAILSLSLTACTWQAAVGDPRSVLPSPPALGKHVQLVLTTGDMIELDEAVVRSDSIAGIRVEGGTLAVPLSSVREIRERKLTRSARKWLLVGGGSVIALVLLREWMEDNVVFVN